jgi:hypothetical protein
MYSLSLIFSLSFAFGSAFDQKMLGSVALLTFWLAATSLPVLCCWGYYYFSFGFFISYDKKLFLREFGFYFIFEILLIGPPA